MGAFIPQAGGARGAAFAVAAAVLFAVLAVLWLLAARGDRPEYRRASRLFVTGTAATAVLLACTALLPASARVPAWGLIDAAYLAGFAAVIITASPVQASALIITDTLTERFGAFIIIVLGETLTGVVAAMGASMVSLVDHAHDGRTPAATAWVLSAGAAIVLGSAMLVAASLPAWDRDRGLYRPLARTCAVVAVACLGLGAARPTPLILGLALVLLLSIPWGLAVARRLANGTDSAAQ